MTDELKHFDMRVEMLGAIADRAGFTRDERSTIGQDVLVLRVDAVRAFADLETAYANIAIGSGNFSEAERSNFLKEKSAKSERVTREFAGTTRALNDQIVAMEAAAMAGHVPAPHGAGYVDPTATKEPTTVPDLYAAQRRDAADDRLEADIRAMSPTERELEYLHAVEHGDDPAFVRVIERAAKRFPLVRPHAWEAARRLRLERSPLRPAIERARIELDVREGLVRSVREAFETAFAWV